MADLHTLLKRTSRTFGLAIPLLEEPLRREVAVAYLLFRIADSLEDATNWPMARKAENLEAFVRSLQNHDRGEADGLAREWQANPPIDHVGYTELLTDYPPLLDDLRSLSPVATAQIRHHCTRTASAMAAFIHRDRDRPGIGIRSLFDLRQYCYAVAGIVGELLTELFLLRLPQMEGRERELRDRAASFGEGLQLVNILRDSKADAGEARLFEPPRVDRGHLIALARADLIEGRRYVECLRTANAGFGITDFTALPVVLAESTLAKVERDGPGAKVSRDELNVIRERVREATASGGPLWLD